MKNYCKMIAQDGVGLLAAVFLLLSTGFLIATLTLGLIAANSEPPYVVVNMNPLREYRLLTVRNLDLEIPYEVLAALPESIEVIQGTAPLFGTDIAINIADISGLTTYDFIAYRDMVMDILVRELANVGVLPQVPAHVSRELQLQTFFNLSSGSAQWSTVPDYVPDASHTRVEMPQPTFGEAVREMGLSLIIVIPAVLLVTSLVVLDLRMRKWRKATFGIKE